MWKKVVIAALSSVMLIGAAALTAGPVNAADEYETPIIPIDLTEKEESEESSEPEESKETEESKEPEESREPEESEESQKPEKLSVKIKLSAKEINKGKQADVTIQPSGGIKPYTYLFAVKTNGSWQVKEDENSNTFQLPSSKTGYYTVKAGVRSADGHEVYKTSDYAVIKKTGKALKNSSSVSQASAAKGSKIKLNAKASGGTEPYMYQYSYKYQGDSKWTELKAYSSSTSANLKLTKTGTYNVKIRVKDYTGKYKDYQKSVKVFNKTGKALKNKSKLSGSIIEVKNKLKINASCTGGTAPYSYEYYYKKSGDKKWTKIKSSTSKAEKSFSKSGKYKLLIRVRDFSGKKSDKTESITVIKDTGKDLSNKSTLDKNIVKANQSFNIKAKASGGVLPYRYSYYYKTIGGKWTKLKGYSDSSKYSVKFKNSGYYNIKVCITDADDAYQEKIIELDVTGKKTLTSVNTSAMMSDAAWASSTVTTIPAGKTMDYIDQSGAWFRVRYGKKVGWMYNLTFGRYTNYTAID